MQSHQSQGWSFAKSGQNTTLEEGVNSWQSHFVYKRHAQLHTPMEQFTHTKSTTAQITKNYFAKARYFSYVCRYMIYARTLAHP